MLSHWSGRAGKLVKAMSDRGVALTEINQNTFLDVLARSSDFDAAEKYFLHEMECSKVIRLVILGWTKGLKQVVR